MAGAVAARLAILRRADALYELSARLEDGTVRVSATPLAADHALALCWARMARVRTIDSALLHDLRAVARDTRIDPLAEPPTLQPLRVAPPPPPHRPTAANPRAYKGTKDRPPKPRRPDPQDLRPHLCSTVHQDRLFAAVCAELDATVVDAGPEFRDAPAGFRRELAWLLRDAPEAARVRAAYWSLDLDSDTALRALLALTLACHGAPAALDWSRVLPLMEPGDRTPILARALAAHAIEALPPPVADHSLAAAVAACSGPAVDARRDYVIACLRRGDDLQAVVAGFALADAHLPEHEFTGPPAPPAAATAIATIPTTHLDVLAPLRLWQQCGSRPELIEVIAGTDWNRLTPDAGRRLTEVLRHPPARRGVEAELVQAVIDTPRSHQTKAVGILWDIVEFCRDTRHFQGALGIGLEAMRAVCEPPAPTGGHGSWPIERLALLHGSGRADFAALPASGWRALDAASARRNDAVCIGAGLRALGDACADLVRRGLAEHPSPLLRAARTLGLLAPPYAELLIEQAMQHPVWCDAASIGLQELLERLPDPAVTGGFNPVPRRLREYRAGKRSLSPAQLERDTARVRAAWPAVVLHALHHHCTRALAESALGEHADRAFSDERLAHAVLLHAETEESRRALRRALRRYAEDNSAGTERHPANVQWLRRHPRVDATLWTRGVVLEETLPDGRSVRIAIERDPLEALRLGTHVGSCFGLGGAYNHSAIAVALDINKQVAFARDADGTFIARQIVAITDEDRLQCLAVYPLATGPELRRLFQRWNRQLADALDLPLAPAKGDVPRVELLVAESWWNDGVWYPKVSP